MGTASSLPDENELILRDKSLKKLSKNMFKKYQNIRVLDLTSNFIQVLPKHVNQLKSLEVIKLANNEIISLPKEILDIKTLKYLNIARNQISEIPEPISLLHNLTTLDISGNKLKQFPLGIADLSLIKLKCGNLNLTDIPDVIFSIKSLESLDLRGNRIDHIDDRITQLSNIKVLNLESNPLTSIPSIITELKSLTYLNVSHTSVSDIENYRFDHIPKLKHLILSCCRISKFSIFIGNCYEIETIDLSVNLLKSIPHQIGFTYKTLKKLYLNENQLISLPGEISMFNKDIHLELKGNPLESPIDIWKSSLDELFDTLIPYCKAYGPNCEALMVESLTQHKGSSFKIQAYDYMGRKRLNGGDHVNVIFRSIDNQEYECDKIIKDHKDGTYEVFFKSERDGTLLIEITCNDMPIKDSPFKIEVIKAEKF